MADFPDLERPADQRDDVVRSHPFSFVHEKDTVRSYEMGHGRIIGGLKH
jgi:hypothetical protein